MGGGDEAPYAPDLDLTYHDAYLRTLERLSTDIHLVLDFILPMLLS